MENRNEDYQDLTTELELFWSPKTLAHIEQDVFFKQELPTVKKITDDAFMLLLRSNACDDDYYRNMVLDSWFASMKLNAVIAQKIIPENVDELIFVPDC